MLTFRDHDELLDNLALARGGVSLVNVCLGSAWSDTKTPRADLVVCRPSYTRFCLDIYEVKLTRSDFLSDIRSEKWRAYLPHCHRFYFAVMQGVCSKEDVPAEAGLVVYGVKGWGNVKAAPRQKHEIPMETMMALVFARQRQGRRIARLNDIEAMNKNSRYQREDWFTGRLKAARVLGKDMGKLHEAAMRAGGIEKAVEKLKEPTC